MTVYFVRHGESVANRALVLSGVFDHPLTEAGRAQAREAGRRLAGVRFARVYTSVLCRAVETADIILAADAARDRAGPVVIRDRRLNERDFGIYEDVAQAWIAEHHGDETLHRVHTDVGFRMEGGESIHDVFARATGYFDEAIRPHAGDGDILVVSHGNVTKCLIAHCVGWPVEIIPEMPMWNGLVTRLCV
jgi:broad specificity phosphatase PhoE